MVRLPQKKAFPLRWSSTPFCFWIAQEAYHPDVADCFLKFGMDAGIRDERVVGLDNITVKFKSITKRAFP